MSGRHTSYEIQVLQEKNWVIQEIRADEAAAMAYADSLLQKGNLQAVRVVRTYMRQDGSQTETVVLEKQGDGKAKADLTLVQVQESPVCRTVDDVLTLSARLTVGRMARKYLDEMVLTPTELLHSPAELKRFGDKDRLLMTAVDIAAGLQAKQTGEEPKIRREALFKLWEQVFARARGTVGVKLPEAKTFAALRKLAAGAGEERAYQLRALMVRRLVEQRSWLGKLDLLLEWAAESGIDADMVLIDGVVADLMIPAQVLQDLMGFQNNLGTALCSICDLAYGRAEAAKFAPSCFAALNALFAGDKLPQARQVLLNRVTRELRGTNPLSRNEPGQEYEMFSKLLHHVVGDLGVVGGPAMAEALVTRYGSMVQVYGQDSTLRAIEGLLGVLCDSCRRVHLLLALGETGMPKELLELLQIQVEGSDHINFWVPTRMGARDRMVAMTTTHGVLSVAAQVPNPPRAGLAQSLDDVLARYLVDEGVIEKIDKADDPLAMRAIRLIKFCGSGVLIKGKSLDLARGRVIEHLRQPQFEEKFLASSGDTGQGEKNLREFHRLLREVGFA
ncbi:MAG TPA: hypothetical protein VM661_11965 [Candidatus Sulfotelmatobacter sp.]|jgi:hypothetical protein|nr:hypothetical protein [Candidatus Sulfotelmatobacter sp.]